MLYKSLHDVPKNAETMRLLATVEVVVVVVVVRACDGHCMAPTSIDTEQ